MVNTRKEVPRRRRPAGAAPRKPRARLGVDERREELLELGLRLFGTRPYDEVSTDDIANAAGISKGLMYHYFPRKRDFYVATLKVAAERLLSRTQPDTALPPPVRLYRGLEAYLDYVEGFATSYAALLTGGIGADAEAAAIVEGCREKLIGRVLDAMGVAEPRPALRVALRGWDGFVEMTSLDWLAKRDLPRESLLRMMVAALVAAVQNAQEVDPEVRIGLLMPG